MPLVQLLGVVLAAVESGREVLRQTHHRLDQDQDVSYQAEDRVGRDEVGAVVGDFVVFDDYEAGDGRQEGDGVEGGVRDCAGAFLFCRVS